MSLLRAMSAALPEIDRRSIRDIEKEIEDELEFHLEMCTEDNIRLGMTAADALAAAVARFGDYASIRQACRKTLLGERIMLQRLQTAIIGILFIALLVLAYRMYSINAAMAEVQAQLARIQGVTVWEAIRPRVVDTFPRNGDTDIDPSISEIRVTFDKEMSDRSWSWVRSSDEPFPEASGDVHYLTDLKTCVMPVKLEPGTKYVVWFNTVKYQNFKDRDGRPAEPYSLTFTTRE
jgi:hypothetical protein